MIALLLVGCGWQLEVNRPLPATVDANVPVCERLPYDRSSIECVDLFLCSKANGASVVSWLQTRPPTRSIPAVRFPSSGCDPQDCACITKAEQDAKSWACRGGL